ncbi:hypothetical protein [Streptomyces caeruleatus]|uniref:hypothetical protein n=1 Tax=Streptomyces caeruleatus TaxID=661399 RepID=UPI001FC9FAAB|nr:hypothetical protein [Streptomyces caeruleatus]
MGSWGTLGPALLSLAGVVLGAGGSLFGQYLVSRASTRQLEVQESATHRAELKNAVLKFLGLASQVEKAALAPSGAGGATADAGLDQLVDDLWLAHAEIDLAARSEPLRGAAYRYAARLAEAAKDGISDGSALRGPQARFFDAAYDDMWPGHRRAAGDSVTPQ